jgi:four helix bundle protein
MARFDHEKLMVYQTSLRFVEWSHELLTDLPKTYSVHNQLDRAMTSIPLNLAEGNGKYTPADRCRFFDNARGSALECAACLDVMVARKLTSFDLADVGKAMLADVVSMTVGLIRANSDRRTV